MYDFLSLFNGILIAIMISINGNLAIQYGSFASTIIIHVVGIAAAFLLMLITRRHIPRHLHLAPWQYLGGAIGFFTTFFDNLAFGKISMTGLLAISLFAQTLCSLLIDSTGMLGMKKVPFKKSNLAGLLFSFAGIAFMIFGSEVSALAAILFSFLTGITVVLSRTVNAGLSEQTGALQGSFINHLAGLPFAILFTVLMAGNELPALAQPVSPALWIYIGGIFGVTNVLICNVTVPKVSAFMITLLSFVGQIFAGLALDLFLGNGYSRSTFIGGLIISAGMILNMILDRFFSKKKVTGSDLCNDEVLPAEEIISSVKA